MKNKLICLFLVLLLLPCGLMFSACGKEEGYKLSNLETEYLSLANKYENVKIENNKLFFNYNRHVYGDKQYLTDDINSIEPYSQIKNYDFLLDNILCFVSEYIDNCSSDLIEAEASVRNDIKASFDAFETAISDVNLYINQWSEVVRFNFKGNHLDSSCLARFKNLLDSYSKLYQRSINFSNNLAKFYYEYALNDSNPKVNETSLENFNANVVISKLESRLKYQISNLSQSFVEMYLDGENVSVQMVIKQSNGKYGELDLTEYGYLENINEINKTFETEKAIEICNNPANKEKIYNLSVQAYSLQNILSNDRELFLNACNSIVYSYVNEKSSAKDIVFKKTIENNLFIIDQYNTVLKEILNIIKSA